MKKKSKRNVGKKQSKRNGRKTIKRGGAALSGVTKPRALEDEARELTDLLSSITINTPNPDPDPDPEHVFAVPDGGINDLISSFKRWGVTVNNQRDLAIIVDQIDAVALSPKGVHLGNIDTARQDRVTVAAAVSREGTALKHASKDMKNDRVVGMIAVKNNGMALADVGIDLKNDIEVCWLPSIKPGWRCRTPRLA